MALGDAYRGIEDKYYALCEWLQGKGVPAIKFFVEPIESRGVPSLPIAILLLAVIVGGAYFALSSQPTQAAFKIRVLAGDEAVTGAVVEVYDNGVLVATSSTDRGVAEFSNLPRKSLEFRVTQGGKTISKQVDLTRRATDTVQFEAAGAGFAASVLVVDSNSSTPIKDARVLYSYADVSASVNTDAKGRARIPVPEGVEVSIRVTHPSYRQVSLTFIASSEAQLVKMESKALSPLYLSAAPSGLIVLTVTGPAGEPVDGEARVYDAFSFAKISNTTIDAGSGIIEDVPVGSLVYVVVEAAGYLTYDGSLQPFSVEEATDVPIEMVEATPENSGETIVRTVDENGNPVAAKVFLLSETNSILTEEDSTGELTLEVATGIPYYAAAVADGRIPARSNSFQAGQSVTISLVPATDSNSANLSVAAFTRDGSAIPLAAVTVTTPDDSFAVPQASTNSEGVADFYNLALGNYNVRAVYSDEFVGTLKSAESINLDANKTLTLVMESPDGFLKLGAVDVTPGKPVSANFTSFFLNADGAEVAYSTCAGTTCVLPLRSGAESRVSATASGYAQSWISETVQPNEEKNASITLIPNALVKGVGVELLNVTDFYGNPAANLLAGKTYTAKFRISSEGGFDSTGLYVRIGTRSSVTGELGGILEDGYPIADKVAKSTSFNTGVNCTDLKNNQPVDGLLKWVDLSWKKGGSRVIEIRFRVSENARTGDSLTIAFRSYGVRGGKWTRNPQDFDLGLESNSTGKAGCYAAANEKQVPVIAPASAEVPEAPAAEFTETASIFYDPETRKVKASVDEFVLQVDTVFPFDAIPLNFSTTDILASQVQSTANPSTSRCYAIESGSRGSFLVFRPSEDNPACPIGVKSNSIDGDESAMISFSSIRNPTVSINVSIKLKANSLSSVFVKPDSLSEGDQSAKLIFLVNQKQTQRVVDARVGSESKQYILNPGAKALAWRGPGTLSLSEGGEGIWELDYPQVKSYFPGMHDLGLVLRKSCTDYLCCANGWCSRDGAKTAFDLFKEHASRLAASTAFRRGNKMPMAYFFPSQEFSMSMVAQLREGTDVTALGEGITFSAASAGNCRTGNPGVYEITASSPEGSTWNYRAEVMPLFKTAYVTDACDRTQYYYRSTPSEGEYLPLCDFLFGEANCVRAIDHATLTSGGQPTDEHIKPVYVPSWFIGLTANMILCKTQSAAFTKARAANDLKFETLVSTGCAPIASCLCGGEAFYPGQIQGTLREAYNAYKACIAYKGGAPVQTVKECAEIFKAAAEGVATSADLVTTTVSGYDACSVPCGEACGGEIQGFITGFMASEIPAGEACEKNYVDAGLDPRSWDLPGIILPRAAWMTCYAYADGCHLRCSKRAPYVLIIPANNQKWYIIHVGLTKNCLPNPFGISVALAILDALGPEFLQKNLGQFSGLPLLVANVVGLADALSDPFAPGGLDPKDSAKMTDKIPTKGTEDLASEASEKATNKKLSDIAVSLIPQIAATAIQGSTPSNAGKDYNKVGS